MLITDRNDEMKSDSDLREKADRNPRKIKMKASEITNERLIAILDGTHKPIYPDEVVALAQAELDRRGEKVMDKPASCCQCNWSNTNLLNMAQEPNYAAELWCHGCLQRLVDAHRDETGKFVKIGENANLQKTGNPALSQHDCYFCGKHTAMDCQLCQSDLTKKLGFKPKEAAKHPPTTILPASEIKILDKICEIGTPTKPEPVEPSNELMDSINQNCVEERLHNLTAWVQDLQNKYEALEQLCPKLKREREGKQ